MEPHLYVYEVADYDRNHDGKYVPKGHPEQPWVGVWPTLYMPQASLAEIHAPYGDNLRRTNGLNHCGA